VEISPLKTHVSKDTYEFAKRWYQDGKEVTPFPILAYSDKKYCSVGAEISHFRAAAVSSIFGYR